MAERDPAPLRRARTVDLRAPLDGLRVLMIDPHDASRSVLRAAIAQMGCRTHHAAGSYADAMRLLRDPGHAIDLVFCEFNLNGPRDGQQLLEELRHGRLLPLGTAFLMITGEAAYGSVVSVAEFAPDDYLIKPYSVTLLQRRINRTLYKKRVLAPAYALIEAGAVEPAVEACLTIGRAHRVFVADCWRMAIDVLVGAGKDGPARALLERLLALKAVPWATLGLAGITARAGDLATAAAMLEGLLGQHPDFLRVHDVLADIRHRQGLKAAALQVLQAACAKSAANVQRMRRLGAMAEALGDVATAEQAFSRVIERTRDSGMVSGEDFGNLSRLLLAQDKAELAEQLAQDQRRMLKGHPDAALSDALLAVHRAERFDEAALDPALDALIGVEAHDTTGAVSPRLVVQAVRACLEHNREEAGFRMASRLARRAGLNAEVLHDMHALLDDHRAQRSARAARALQRQQAAAPAGAGFSPP